MESKALEEYKVPDYPKKEQVQAQPSLLRISVNKRWQKLYDLGISGMLVAGLSLSGCDNKPVSSTTTTGGIVADPTEDPNATPKNNAPPSEVMALVAPIFEHGEGRGSFGCQSITPPAFISEDEALAIIKEEFEKHGLKLDQEKVALDNVKIAYGKITDIPPGAIPIGNQHDVEEVVEPLEVDFKNSEKEIYIEYVSMDDYFMLGGERGELSIQSFDFKKVAVGTRQKLNQDAEQGVYGVFYDPMFQPDYSNVRSSDGSFQFDKIQILHNKGMESSKELLRNQVNDFAQWLKEQGVI